MARQTFINLRWMWISLISNWMYKTRRLFCVSQVKKFRPLAIQIKHWSKKKLFQLLEVPIIAILSPASITSFSIWSGFSGACWSRAAAILKLKGSDCIKPIFLRSARLSALSILAITSFSGNGGVEFFARISRIRVAKTGSQPPFIRQFPALNMSLSRRPSVKYFWLFAPPLFSFPLYIVL